MFGSPLLTVAFGALTVLLLACGVVATVMVWTDSKRLASPVLARACYLGVAGAVLMSVLEYRLFGPVDAAAVLFAVGLVMWLTAEQQARTAGRRVWLLPALERAIRWAVLRRPNFFDTRFRRAGRPFLTLSPVRVEYAHQVLQDARVDPNLEEYLVALSANLLGWLRDKEGSIDTDSADDRVARLARRRVLLLGFANGLIDSASEPGAHNVRIERPYAGYSQVSLLLAAVCRLACNRRLLVS